jgi:hypothetical protein
VRELVCFLSHRSAITILALPTYRGIFKSKGTNPFQADWLTPSQILASTK